MFQRRNSSYGLKPSTSDFSHSSLYKDSVTRNLESVKRLENRDTPSAYLAIVEDANGMVSRIILNNGRIGKLR